MKLVCNKQLLSEIINTVQKAVTAKTVMPILECIKIEAYMNGDLIITGNNLDICLEYKSSCTVTEPGSVAISSKIFGEIIRRFPDGDVYITVNYNNNVMFLKCGNSEFNIQGLNADDYPSVPQVSETYKFSIAQSVLKRMLRKTIYAVSNNESKRPILTGSNFEINTGVLTIVSTDSFRIAKIEAIVDSSLENTSFVIPGLTLRELLKVLEDVDDKIDIVISKRHVKFCFENFTVVSRLLEGEYVNYKPILNTPNSITVKVNARRFTECLERAGLIIEDTVAKNEKVPVRLNIKNDRIDLTCTTGRGNINDEVEVEKLGDDLEIGFNHKYLIEALRGCDDEFIKMEFSSARGACFIRPTNNNDYVYMILPVRIYEK